MKKIVISAFALATIIFASCENKKTTYQDENALANIGQVTENSQQQKMTNQEFVSKAYAGNLAEVQMAEMVQSKATNKQVKDFAKQLKDDHTKANQELKSLAQKKNIKLSDTLSSDKKNMLTEMKSMSATDLEESFMDMMEKEHQSAVKLYQKAVQDITDQDLNKYASNTLPTLKNHLDKAKKINQSLEQAKANK